MKAIDNGYNSVMIDAADLPLEENIKAVKTVVDYAHARNVHVEAEIGKIKSVAMKDILQKLHLLGLKKQNSWLTKRV